MKWSENMAKKKMTEKEKQDWEALYFYVKKLLGYDENQALSSTMVLRLKGLLTNKFIENNAIESTANYSYETILNTFKYCCVDIQKALRTNSFKDEMHKFNYILKIVERNINTVYMKTIKSQELKEKTENVLSDIMTNESASYQRKSTKTLKSLEDLW